MKITVIGLGYVGLTTAVCLAKKGNIVIGIDKDKEKVKKLSTGIPIFYEEKMKEFLNDTLKNGKLNFTDDEKVAYSNSSVIYICVGTPNDNYGVTNLRYLYEAIDEIIENTIDNKIIVIKSTVPVGTGDDIEKYINKRNKTGMIEIVSNPEFLSQGTAVNDMMNGSRIVIGTLNNEVRNVMSNIYKNFETPLFFTDRCSAEMIKYASNSFLALKISYINEIANLCECVNANVEDVAIGMSYDDRIGNKFLKPGVGYGGSCFPKDTRAFVNLAYKKGAYLNIINELIKVNDRQNFILLQKAKKYYSTFNKLKIAILGLTFKANTDDLRESPALKNIEILLNSGAEITAYDPKATSNAKKIYPQVKYCFSIEEALINADICFIFTDWDEIRKFDVNNFSNFMKIPIVIDGRNCYDTKLMKGVNIIYESVGRSVIKNTNLE